MLSIDQKAEELYEKRIAPYAKDISPSTKKAIIDFQKLIFTIDHYGEYTKDVDSATLNSFWTQAEKFLDDLKVEKSVQPALLQDIKDYADIEASTRVGKKLTDYDIKLFYFKKSCDVRMQRHLIRYLNDEPPVSSNKEITRDILEEIEDDIDDLVEDRSTPFNGNRFLEGLNSKEKAPLEEYAIFLDSLKNAPNDLVQRITKKIRSV